MKYHRLLRKVVSLQRSKRLIPEGSKLLIAFSGGVDSVALALAMQELRGFLKLQRVALAHINHQLRGEESERDEHFCMEFAQKRGFEIFVERLGMNPESSNLEAKARELRYRALEKIREKEGFDLVATAHHLGDLVETVLLWITRGAGREGLLGFSEKEGRIVRPLYTCKREEILDFVKSEGESWVEDSTNHDLGIPRNLIRHRVIPELKRINPELEESVLRLLEILREEESFISNLTQKAIQEVYRDGSMDRRVFLGLPKAIQRRVIYQLYGLRSLKEVESIIRSIKKGSYLKSSKA